MAMRERLHDEELWISVFVVCELMAGAELSRQPATERVHVIDFCGALQIAYPDHSFAGTYTSITLVLNWTDGLTKR